MKTDVDVFLLNLNAFSNFSPSGSVTPLTFGPIIVKFENTGAVCGVLDEPCASLSDSKQLESPGASERLSDLIDNPN